MVARCGSLVAHDFKQTEATRILLPRGPYSVPLQAVQTADTQKDDGGFNIR